VDSAPASALHRIDLATGSELVVRPIEGLSFPGTLSGAFDGVVLFSSAAGVTAYNGSTGARLWSAHGAVPEGIDHSPRRIYLTEGSNLVGVDPQTGKVKATASGSAVNGAAGVYVVRNGVALGLDQGASGGAWGYALAGAAGHAGRPRAALAALLRRPERRRRQRRPGRQPGGHRGLPAAGAPLAGPAKHVRAGVRTAVRTTIRAPLRRRHQPDLFVPSEHFHPPASSTTATPNPDASPRPRPGPGNPPRGACGPSSSRSTCSTYL
jgi:hypothetical protein